MKSIVVLLAVVASLNSFAKTTIKIQCQEMDYPFVNRFSLNAELEVSTTLRSLGVARFYNQSLTMSLTNRGVDGTTSETIEVNSRGKVKYFGPGTLSNNEVILIQSTAKDSEGYFINLLLDHPTKNSSQIRTTDGKVYKSNCTIVSERSCVFGETLRELKNSKEFTSKVLGDFFVASRIYEDTIDAESDIDFKPEVRKMEFTHTATQRTFTAFYTFEDEWDGGNTIGWIEDSYGNKVSSISDSDLLDCKAYK